MVALLVVFFLAPSICRSADTCALTITVLSGNGGTISSTWVELTDANGAEELIVRMKGSILDLCDFKFGPHKLRIGTNECFPVVIENIRLTIGLHQRLTAILNDCSIGEVSRNFCSLYLRIKTETGSSVDNASVALSSGWIAGVSDNYGRIEVPLLKGTSKLTITSPGLQQLSVPIECKSVENITRTVVLPR